MPLLSLQDKLAGKQAMTSSIGYGSFPFSRDHLQLQVQLGPTEMPQRPVTGYSEAYYRLLRTLGVVANQAHTLGISRDDFNSNSFVLATDCEAVSTMSSSGLNLQGVDIRCPGQFLPNGQGQANSGVDSCFSTCHYDVYLEFRAGSVTLLT